MLVKRVYPRWRGEHFSALADCGTPLDLSPLTRGTLPERIRPLFDCRFIPAGAGNTNSDTESEQFQAVYPRWRGEHPELLMIGDIPVGLSPLARGTLQNALNLDGVIRFIPAGAGNTPVHYIRAGRWAVYPRWREEHGIPSALVLFHCGLSPLARGTLSNRTFQPSNVRFIPAGAGNTIPYNTRAL